ncbi:hypothetical protein R3P38DRAFT_3252139 [Favolaschia claudopus]|uniref:F-box domain-containing protein n=1 Tax=Favolaschia claudopus TaxID=2862362 RepID=A0AAW0E8L0_9AGAR
MSQPHQPPTLEEPPSKRRRLNDVEDDPSSSPQEIHSTPASRQTGNHNRATQAPILSFPTELLLDIFDMVLPIDHFLRARPIVRDRRVVDLNEAWRKSVATKKTIILVCKRWYTIGCTILYRDITLLSVESVFSLSATLETDSSLANHIRSLTFLFSTPQQQIYRPEIDDCAEKVAAIVKAPRTRSAPLLPALPCNITSLALGSHVHDGLFARPILQESCSRLQELSVFADALLWRLVFPQLHTLRLTSNGSLATFGLPDDDKITLRAALPQLTHLTFRMHDRHHAFSEQRHLFAEYQLCLQLYGEKLQYLQFPDCDGTPGEETNWVALLQKCPHLIHVVLPSWAGVSLVWRNADAAVRFRTVKHVDVWRGNVSLQAQELQNFEWARILASLFPDAMTLRRMDGILQNVFLEALPRMLHPSVRWRMLEVVPGTTLRRVELPNESQDSKVVRSDISMADIQFCFCIKHRYIELKGRIGRARRDAGEEDYDSDEDERTEVAGSEYWSGGIWESQNPYRCKNGACLSGSLRWEDLKRIIIGLRNRD